jgi:hypothetical protein
VLSLHYLSLRVVLLCLAALGGCAGQAVSPTDQTLIQEADQLHARLEPAVVEKLDPRLKRYFEQIGARIVAAAKELDQQAIIQSREQGSNEWMFAKEIGFHLVDSAQPNCFTAGGKHIYIYDGLFQQCQNEDELASLLCHEYAHIYGRHVQKELKRDPSITGDNALLYPFVTLKFTAPHERTADSIAFNVFAKGGWDTSRFAELYQRLLQNASAGSWDVASLREKVEAAQRRELPAGARDWAQPPVADDARFTQLQAESKSLVLAKPRSERAQLLLTSFSGCLIPADTPAQASARQRLFPPPPPPSENKWNKGLQGAR